MAEELTDYQKLRNFIKTGRDHYLDNIDLVNDYNRKINLPFTTVDLEINEDDFYDWIDISEDDGWFAKVMFNPYSDYNFIDSGSFYDDFEQGYGVFNYFDEDNLELLKKIASILLPHHEFVLDSIDQRAQLSKLLLEVYEKETNNIVDDLINERETQLHNSAREYISNELDTYLDYNGIKVIREFDLFKTTVGNLIYLYHRTGLYDYKLDKMLEYVFRNATEKKIGGWYESPYEMQNDDHLDLDSFNRTVTWNLEKILDKLEEDGDVQKFIEMTERIKRKYKPGHWYNLPKDKKVVFKIDRFDKDTNKIKGKLRWDLKVTEFNLSEENFYKLLYQPTLFVDMR